MSESLLWYSKEASSWDAEALPVGNGRLGAMLFGGPASERVLLNEGTLWSGGPLEEQEAADPAILAEARSLISKERYFEAQGLIEARFLGRDSAFYRPLGDLLLEFQGLGEIEGYRRELDLSTGIASLRFKSSGCAFKRELFCSQPDQCLVFRLEAEKPGALTLKARVQSPLQGICSPAGPRSLKFSGLCAAADAAEKDPADTASAMRFEIRLMALAEGGSLVNDGSCLELKGGDALTLLLVARTSFNGFEKDPAADGLDQAKLCYKDLSGAAGLGYTALKERHLVDHRALYGRCELSLGGGEPDPRPTDERLAAFREDPSPSLAALYFNFGRYLLAACSRPGGQPATLQGLWNAHFWAPWRSNYTTNINLQMNYWPAEPANLAECAEPLFKMLEELSRSGAEVAAKRFGSKGWTLNHNSDIWRRANCVQGQARWAFWPMGGAWLCRHLWEHYAFGGDREFLKRAWPVMKGAAEFLLSWLQEDGEGGLWSSPSSSPENAFLDSEGRACTLSAGSAMDTAICRDHLGNCLAAARELGVEDEFQAALDAALKRLHAQRIGARGQLQEWSKDFPEEEPGHRHMSHLYGLHPAAEISPRGTPELAAAAARSLELRLAQGGGHTGWSCAWIVNFFARLGKGEGAWEHLRTLLGRSTHPNLFDVHPPFQIDGNFGGCAGIAEMLLQSHLNEIELLPALPKAWEQGRMRGIRARGGLELDLSWKGGKLEQLKILAHRAGTWKLRAAGKVQEIQLDSGESREFSY